MKSSFEVKGVVVKAPKVDLVRESCDDKKPGDVEAVHVLIETTPECPNPRRSLVLVTMLECLDMSEGLSAGEWVRCTGKLHVYQEVGRELGPEHPTRVMFLGFTAERIEAPFRTP